MCLKRGTSHIKRRWRRRWSVLWQIMGSAPRLLADEVEQAVDLVTAEEVYEEQSRIRHNIRSLVNVIRRKISPEARPYVHLFATSADILDTATALRFKALTENVIIPDLVELETTTDWLGARACGHSANREDTRAARGADNVWLCTGTLYQPTWYPN